MPCGQQFGFYKGNLITRSTTCEQLDYIALFPGDLQDEDPLEAELLAEKESEAAQHGSHKRKPAKDRSVLALAVIKQLGSLLHAVL